jgi:outer membrane receptor protein involved in Fe transport
LGADVSGSLTAGFDHYDFPITSFGSFGGLLNTTGNLLPAPGMSLFADRNSTKNTGYFAQAQLGFRDALFLTGGLRAEQSTNFGDSLGTPMSPRFGLSYAHGVGPATLKVRGSWGRAIRAPDPATKGGGRIGNVVTLANPTLGPERQQGWDAGVDAVFGGGSLSFTYYDQTADDLIQLVQEATPPFVTRQNRNVGRVKNTGLELEAALSLGALQLKGHYGYARARIERLAPSYTGDLRIGDQVPNTPRHTAGASLSATPIAATTLAAGLTYVGSWREYDYFAVFSCFAGTGPCQPTFREYLTTYASFTKLNASIFRQIGQTLSGFVSVDNVANTKVVEGSNIGPVWGRVTTVGLQVQY